MQSVWYGATLADFEGKCDKGASSPFPLFFLYKNVKIYLLWHLNEKIFWFAGWKCSGMLDADELAWNKHLNI